MHRIRILISGKVQGVFFRDFIKTKALELGLKGYTRNLNKTTVEVLAEGHELIINQLIQACEKGVTGSEIASVKISRELYKGEFKEFKIRG